MEKAKMSNKPEPAEEASKGRARPIDAHDCKACNGTGKKRPEVWPKGGTDCWACRGRGWFISS